MKLVLLAVALATCAFSAGSFTMREIRSVKPRYWHAKITYPHFNGSSALIRYANGEIKHRADTILAGFVKEAKESAADHVRGWFLTCSFKVDLDCPYVISVRSASETTVQDYTPSNDDSQLSLGIINGRPRRLRLSDFVTSRDELHRLLTANIRSKESDPNEINDLQPADLERFTVTRTGVAYDFAPGKIAFWGMDDIKGGVKWSQLKSLRRTGPLKLFFCHLKTKVR